GQSLDAPTRDIGRLQRLATTAACRPIRLHTPKTLNGHSGGIGRLQRWFRILGSQIPVALRARTNFFFHLP
ncbi:hypothetical protein, partial [Bradyrhizobium sp. MOS001]|uniref:hypothetical protein n=1 Tax=Bradyrhizobium sp. MOS001 TaxID=2133948 RepID=UPI001960C5A5